MRKSFSLLWFLFGYFNSLLANQLLINVKVVDDCKHAKVLVEKIKDVKFYRGKLKKSELSSEKEITGVENNIITFTDDDSKWITLYFKDIEDFSLYKFMEGCKALEIVLIGDEALKIPKRFRASMYCFHECENLKIISLKSIIDSCTRFWTNRFQGAFQGCSNLRYVNFENMQENIGFFTTPLGTLNPFYKCKKLVAIFVNKNAINFFLRVAPNDVYFLCYKGDKKIIVENIGKKYENRIIEVDNQEDVLNFFIENKDMEKEELRKKFQDTFVK